MRTPIIAGNWKMNLGRLEDAIAFVRRIRPALSEIEGIEVVLCPPFTVLAHLSEILAASKISLGAQTMHWEPGGAHTGEISGSMIADLCQYVILGHSERRASNPQHESDEAIRKRIGAAFEVGLKPIVCVGENSEQFKQGETNAVVGNQVSMAIAGLEPDQVAQMVIAYEPIWAIGSGEAATPADANRVIGLSIRKVIADHYGEAIAQTVRVQYGGSVNADNIRDFMTMPDIDGALVGGASLKPGFVDLVRNTA
ncbi:MAG: triose-phosphate isomerase [Anaerolineales bacterium]|nr:MAG: triose-phosphate isomerase [Anaerolineales bacterium]